MKVRFLKSVNDFIIGMALLALGIFIGTYDKILTVPVTDSVGGILVRPDVYVRMIGVLLAVCALILVLKSINYKRAAETEGFRFVLTKEVVWTGLSLLLYALLLEPIGFYISTFILTIFLACMYMRVERRGEGKKPLTRKTFVIAVVYAIGIVILVHLVFAKVLNVVLPSGDLFS